MSGNIEWHPPRKSLLSPLSVNSLFSSWLSGREGYQRCQTEGDSSWNPFDAPVTLCPNISHLVRLRGTIHSSSYFALMLKLEAKFISAQIVLFFNSIVFSSPPEINHRMKKRIKQTPSHLVLNHFLLLLGNGQEDGHCVLDLFLSCSKFLGRNLRFWSVVSPQMTTSRSWDLLLRSPGRSCSSSQDLRAKK